MVKMAHPPLPKVPCKPINASNMCPTDFAARSTLADVLQSGPVKRLFNQPNITVKTFPVKTRATSKSDNNVSTNQTNSLDTGLSRSKQAQISVTSVQMDQEENKEDENLLPSKSEGKSEITLVPIQRIQKPCGHYEPCENIVCDVAVQQYMDQDGASPMLAVNIEEDEINAPVSKHCSNERCDALSIDHDRCRRAVIRLNRCNQSSACDICGITLKTQRGRIYHRNCARKSEYRHNDTNGAQIMKERMREREIQMEEAAKVKKNDYMDPVTGYNLAMETLRNNDELIIIPKSVTVQQPGITITNVTSSQCSPQVNNVNNMLGSLLSSIPIVLPQQSIVLGKPPCSNENNMTAHMQVALPEALNNQFLTATTTIPLPQNQYVTFATQSNAQPITLNDLLLSQSQIVSTTPIQPKPLITPIRVVPITNLITQPSLLHQTQGIPKFCIMADSTVPTSLTVSKPPPIRPAPASAPKVEIPKEVKVMLQKRKKVIVRKKRKLKKKDFKCDYCLKRFSTDWYFKIHVARHESSKRFACRLCLKPFSNGNDLKEHISSKHENESNSPDALDQPSVEKHYTCMDCNIVYTSIVDLKHHKEKCYGSSECDYEKKENVSDGNGENSNTPDDEVDTVSLKENDDKKTNGYISVSDQNAIKDIKTELMHEA